MLIVVIDLNCDLRNYHVFLKYIKLQGKNANSHSKDQVFQNWTECLQSKVLVLCCKTMDYSPQFRADFPQSEGVLSVSGSCLQVKVRWGVRSTGGSGQRQRWWRGTWAWRQILRFSDLPSPLVVSYFVTKINLLWIEVAAMVFLRRVSWLSFRDRLRSSYIWRQQVVVAQASDQDPPVRRMIGCCS